MYSTNVVYIYQVNYVITVQTIVYVFAYNSINSLHPGSSKVSSSIPINEVFSFSLAILSPEYSCMRVPNNISYIVYIKQIKTG